MPLRRQRVVSYRLVADVAGITNHPGVSPVNGDAGTVTAELRRQRQLRRIANRPGNTDDLPRRCLRRHHATGSKSVYAHI